MLSYQHHYHAGNHADVLKHWLLLECLGYLQQKEKGFDYIDTHAGAGLYDLRSPLAEKTKEYQEGVERLLQEPVNGMDVYLEQVKPLFATKQYPGSAVLVNQLLRPQDRSWLYELHPQTITELKQHCNKKQTRVRQEDGLKGLISLLPVASRRALVLIDPSYEVKAEYQHVVSTLKIAYPKMPHTLFLLWYPVVDRQRIDQMEAALQRTGIRNICLFELGISDDQVNGGMTASGMIIINPPWTLKAKADSVLPQLSSALAEDKKSRYRSTVLVPEI